MPRRWVCRSRTDGTPPDPEPAIVLEYDLVPCDVALKDVARFVGASLDGTTVRVVTRLDSVREALRQWSVTNGVLITYEDQFRIMADDGLSSECTLDLQRTNFQT